MEKIEIWKLLISIFIAETAGSLGSFFSIPAIPGWYDGLKKPIFNPPNWVFGPVWTILFFLLGISAYLILRKGLNKKAVKTALILYVIQFLLNIAWSFLFFGLRSPLFGLIDIIVLWALIFFTYLKFKQIDSLAGKLLLPYLAWVAFASYLNFQILLLN